MPEKVAPIRRTYPRASDSPFIAEQRKAMLEVNAGRPYRPSPGLDFWSKLQEFDQSQAETERERFYRAHDIQPCMTSREAITSLLLVAGAFLTTALIAVGVWVWVTS